MNYVATIFDGEGRIIDAKLPNKALGDYAKHIGFTEKLSETVYRGGNFQGCIGNALVFTGPFDSPAVAARHANVVKAAALAIENARLILVGKQTAR